MILDKQYVACMVKCVNSRKNKYEAVDGSAILLEPGITLIPLQMISEDAKILDSLGEEIKPTGNFYITAETIDPYHYVIDYF